MFKRYSNPMEGGGDVDMDKGTMLKPQGRQEAPPRVFEEGRPHGNSPYTPSYNVHRETKDYARSGEALSLTSPLSEEHPDTTLGEGVSFKGQLTFRKLLRIDGAFEGELISDGKLIVGATGTVKSNIKMREAIIEGRVDGDIAVSERLELRDKAVVHGSIEAGLLSVDEGVTIVGHVTVNVSSGAQTGV